MLYNYFLSLLYNYCFINNRWISFKVCWTIISKKKKLTIVFLMVLNGLMIPGFKRYYRYHPYDSEDTIFWIWIIYSEKINGCYSNNFMICYGVLLYLVVNPKNFFGGVKNITTSEIILLCLISFVTTLKIWHFYTVSARIPFLNI
jgi:hypothetical protein